MNLIKLIPHFHDDVPAGAGAEGSTGRMADATAETHSSLHHDVPAAKGSALPGRTRFYVREEHTAVQTSATGIRNL